MLNMLSFFGLRLFCLLSFGTIIVIVGPRFVFVSEFEVESVGGFGSGGDDALVDPAVDSPKKQGAGGEAGASCVCNFANRQGYECLTNDLEGVFGMWGNTSCVSWIHFGTILDPLRTGYFLDSCWIH